MPDYLAQYSVYEIIDKEPEPVNILDYQFSERGDTQAVSIAKHHEKVLEKLHDKKFIISIRCLFRIIELWGPITE